MNAETLVKKWRAEAAAYPAATDERAGAAAVAVRLCANELEALAAAPPVGEAERLREALTLLGETVQDIRRMADAVDRGVATRDGCRAFADRVSVARQRIASPAPKPAERNICAHCGEWNEWDEHAAAPAPVEPPPADLVDIVRQVMDDEAERKAEAEADRRYHAPAPVEPPPAAPSYKE